MSSPDVRAFGQEFAAMRLPGPPHDEIPVARPANPVLVGIEADEVPVDEPWFTPEILKGWVSSFSLHALLLVAMALWYFAPQSKPALVLDTRLIGSEMGVDDGLTATGGLSTEIELIATPTPPPEPAAVVPAMSLESLAPRLTGIGGAPKASAGGGVNNPNPGAGSGDGFGLARFGDGGENIRGVEVKVGDPQFTLLWDTEVDLDLHVVEPGGKEIYWEEPNGKQGGELDVDNTKGFGPENIYWLHQDEATGNRVKGQGPPGTYKWFVVYWSGFDGRAKPTRWKVRIKHAGKVTVVTGRFTTLNEHSKTHTLVIAPNESTSEPGVAASP